MTKTLQTIQKKTMTTHFVVQHGPHLRTWIVDSKATNYMTFHRMAFDTYEIIAPGNAYLDNDIVLEVIRMCSIVIEALVWGKIKKIHIKDALNVPNLQDKMLSVSKLLSNMLRNSTKMDV